MAKDSFFVFIPPSFSKKFDNSLSGYKSLLSLLQPDDILGVESTGNYHHKFSLFFLKQKFTVKELNPILTNQFIRSTIRKKKTDKIDAEIISKLLTQGEGYKLYKDSLYNTTKKLSRSRQGLVKQRTSLKIKLKNLKHDSFDTKILKNLYERLIRTFDQEIKILEKKILESENPVYEKLSSIPGISPLQARIIYAELGDIRRFDNAKKCIAFAGLDPKITQSGHSINRKGKLTKRGSGVLRHILFLASLSNIRLNTCFSRYYKKKKNEGKHHYSAMAATSRKILLVIFTLLKNDLFFVDFS